MALYQIYRPHKFSDVINQDVVVETLRNSITHNLIGHAYIFSGPKGTGKTTIAKIFSKAVNCLSFTNDICGSCDNCQLIDSHNTTDILELDAASNNGVDDIRNILETARFLPNNLKYKVYIIDEAHMLSNSAWNALLKTLEEPNDRVIFIFATTEMHKIPGTIVSRCQCFEFHRLTSKQLVDLLTKVCSEQKIKISQGAINTLVNLANGSARDLLSHLEQAALYSNNNISEKDIDTLFGLVSTKNIIQIINSLLVGDVKNILSILNDLEERGIDFCLLTNNLINILLDKIIFEQTNDFGLLKLLTQETINSFTINSSLSTQLIDQCQKAYFDIKNSDNPRFNFEVLMFDLINLAHNFQNPSVGVTSTTVETKEEKPDPEVHIETGEPEPEVNMEAIFNIGEVIKNEPVKKEVKKVEAVVEPTNKQEIIEKILVQIINNRSSQAIQRAKNIFEQIKGKSDVAVFKYLTSAVKVSLASQNGIIFLFDDQLDADLLNQQYMNGQLQRQLIRISSQPMYLMGLTQSQLQDLAKKLNSYADSEYKKEPDIEILRKYLKQTDKYSQFAFEEFEQQ